MGECEQRVKEAFKTPDDKAENIRNLENTGHGSAAAELKRADWRQGIERALIELARCVDEMRASKTTND